MGMRLLGKLVAGAVAAIVCAAPALAQDRRFITFAAGGSSGSWYVGSAVMSELIRAANPDLQVTPVPGGGVANMRTVQAGKAEIAFAIYQTLYEAYEGQGAYDRKHDKLRLIMSTTPFFQQVVVRKNSPIKSFRDMAGKRITPSAKGMGGELTFSRLLELHGLDYKQVESAGGQVLFRNYDDGAKMFMDGQVDVINAGSPAPHPPFSQIAAQHDIRLVPIDPEIAEKFSKEFPGYIPGVIPANRYKGQTEPVPTIVGYFGLVTSIDVPEDVVYRMTKAIYEGRKRIAEAFGAYDAMLEEGAVLRGFPIPQHPGAERYFREIGLLKK